MPDSEGPYVTFEAAGTVTAADVRSFQAELRRIAGDGAPARILMDIVAVEGAELQAVVQDLQGIAEYSRLIHRVAVVGDARWERWLTRAAALVPGLNARYFEPDQRAEAREWLGH